MNGENQEKCLVKRIKADQKDIEMREPKRDLIIRFGMIK